MKFFDHAYITIESGKWWDGCASARREAWVPYGWPNGGNGGRGWHIYFNVDLQLNTLMPFKYHRIYKAHYGEQGKSRDKYGKNADDLILYVPLGTIIKDRHSGNVLFVGEKVLDESYLLLKWGDGGAGNMHFKNSILQYPDFCLMGEPWQYLELELELQLLADVWLIGTPSVGKSSIINMVSNAKAEVAEYHFTTITPNLGSVSVDGIDWNVIDIPGLIQGASDGKGLGIEFLRHILKCSVFNFILDFGRWDEWIQEFGILWNEILTYCKDRFAHEYAIEADDIHMSLTSEDRVLILHISYGPQRTHITNKVIMWTINKSDESDDAEIRVEYQHQLINHIVQAIKQSVSCDIDDSTMYKLVEHNTLWTSTYLHEWITELTYHRKRLVEQYNHTGDIARHTHTMIDPDKPHSVTLIEIQDAREIDGYLEAKPYLIEEEEFDEEEEEEFDEEEEEEFDIDMEELEEWKNQELEWVEEEEDTIEDEELEDEWIIIHRPNPQVVRPEHQINLRSVYEPDITRIVYMIQWGNDQWEQWFWKYMQKSWWIAWLKNHKVKHGDILVFEHPYYGIEERRIIFEA